MSSESVGFLSSDSVTPDSAIKHRQESEIPRPINLDDALELIGLGRVQLELAAICSLTMMAASCEMLGIGVVLPAAKCDLALSTAQQGLVNGATFLGMVSSAYVWGYLSDTRGRRKMMRLALLGCFVCAVASSFANGFVSLLILRLLTGVCVSAPSTTVFAYLGEFCSPSKRALVISYCAIASMLGMAYVGLLGWWILSYDWSIELAPNYLFKPWRLLFPLFSLPGLSAALALRLVPESPKFFAAIGRTNQALEVLQYCYRKNKGSLEGFAQYKLDSEEPAVDQNLGLMGSLWKQTLPLLRWPLVLYFAVCCMQKMSALGVYGGLGVWYPEIMNQVMFAEQDLSVCIAVENVHSSKALTQNSTTDSVCIAELHRETFISMLILATFGVAYNVLNSVLLRAFTEKTMIMTNLLVGAVAGIGLLFVSNHYSTIFLFCTEISLASYTTVLVNSTAVSIFPTRVRAMAVSLSMMMARLSSFMFSGVVGYLIEENCEMTFYIFAGVMIAGASLTVFLPG